MILYTYLPVCCIISNCIHIFYNFFTYIRLQYRTLLTAFVHTHILESGVNTMQTQQHWHSSLCLSRSMFPYGLPSQFSFVSTFRMKSRTWREVWDLLRIEDFVGEPQFGVRIDGANKQVQLYIMDFRGDLQFVTFDNNKKVRGVSQKFHKWSGTKIQCINVHVWRYAIPKNHHTVSPKYMKQTVKPCPYNTY